MIKNLLLFATWTIGLTLILAGTLHNILDYPTRNINLYNSLVVFSGFILMSMSFLQGFGKKDDNKLNAFAVLCHFFFAVFIVSFRLTNLFTYPNLTLFIYYPTIISMMLAVSITFYFWNKQDRDLTNYKKRIDRMEF